MAFEAGRHSGADEPEPAAPRVVDRDADAQFRALALSMGLDPDDRWVGGYVDYEWGHLRLILRAYGVRMAGETALEFGCNYGASSIVMAALGAGVHGVDVDDRAVALARLNARRHGFADIDCRSISAVGPLPYEDGRFGFALCNSVLEYVGPERLPAVIDELHRVLRPGGQLLITGTSSRLAPREVHSGRWLVNWLPRGLDRWLFASPPQRGIDPVALRRLLAGRFADEDGREASTRWLAARGGPSAPFAARLAARIGGRLGLGAGWFAPSLSVMLRRLA